MNTRNTVSSGFGALTISLLLSAGSLPAASPSPRFKGMDLPEPPQQRKTWTPPKTKLPKTFVTATAALFRAGLADPRGCAYRVIEVGTGSCWSGDAGVFMTHAWVLPAPEAKKPRFAVCWNGLVYPAVSVGQAADLKADVTAVVKEDEAMRARAAREDAKWPFYRFRHAWAEGYSLSHQSLLPLKASLLLRLGEEELARQIWTAWTAGMQVNTNDDAVHLKDPFLMLATDWVWAEFDRAVCAHMRGDDRLALVSARSATAMRDAVEKLAEERGFERPSLSRKLAEGEKVPYLTFLEPLPALLADQERRAKQAAKPRPTEREASKRIAGLIDDLDEVSARQWGQPGGVSLNIDGRVATLIREGDAAVEPLLRCLETDTRLTRSVQFHRDFFRYRVILGVHEAAYVALREILENEAFGSRSSVSDPEGRKKAAAEIRAYWQKFKGVPPAERWFRILADDAAGAEQWLQAAQNIVRRDDSQRSLHYLSDNGWVKVPKGGEPDDKTKPRSAALRAKKDPSVNDLLRKRIRQLAIGEDNSGSHDFHQAHKLAETLADWDGPGNLEELARFTRTLREHIAAHKSSNESYFLASLSSWYRRLHRLGDRKALNEYAAWVVGVRPEACQYNMLDVLRPLWEYADHPDIVRAADELFGKGSPWIPLLQKSLGYHSRELLASPLLGLPAFRKAILAALADRSPAGTATPGEGGSLSIECKLGWSSGTDYNRVDPLAPKANTKVAFRTCDVYAWSLSAIRGMPACQLYWPEDKRDEAVAACAAFLRRHGAYLRPNTDSFDFDAYNKTRLTFPLRGRPATKEDVEKGRAIFILTGQGETRVGQLPKRPLPARWTTLKAYPFELRGWDPRTNKHFTTLDHDRDGVVWQAEEVLREGRWQRFYGFVSRHSLARVPAGEIEFPGGPRWAVLSHGLECRLTPRDAKTALVAGAPLVVAVELRNRGGLDQSVPTQWYRQDGPALRPGVRVQLWHTTGEVEKSTQKPRWNEIPARAIGRLKPDEEARTLAPTESFIAFEIDLNDLFIITQPGRYRLLVTFTSKDGGLVDGSSLEEMFDLISGTKSGETKK